MVNELFILRRVDLRPVLALVAILLLSSCGGATSGGGGNGSDALNHVPVPTAPAISTVKNTSGTTQISPNDPDAGDSHTYSLEDPPTNGTVTVDASGLVTYTPNSGFSGTDSFVIKVTDAAGAFGSVTVSVTVSDAGMKWEWVNPKPQGTPFSAVAYSPKLGKYVAIAKGGDNNLGIVTSQNGIHWTAQFVPHREEISDVIWCPDLEIFVAVGTTNNGWNAVALTSSDGISWTSHLVPGANTYRLSAVVWTGTEFIAVGGVGEIATSSNGSDWTIQTITTDQPTKIAFSNILWDGDQFVALGQGGRVMSSPDGIDWQTLATAGGKNVHLAAIAWNPTLQSYVVVGNDGVILTGGRTADTWKQVQNSLGSSASLLDVVWDGKKFVAVGGDHTTGLVQTSVDGVTWLRQPNPDGYFFDLSTGLTYQRILWNGDQFVVVGTMGAILTSRDGVSWEDHFSYITYSGLGGVAWSREVNLFAAVGEHSTILTSPDGLSWTVRNSGAQDVMLQDIVWGARQFVAVGTGGEILTSPDGVAWTEYIKDLDDWYYGITWNGTQFVVVGRDLKGGGTVLTSTDGVNWTRKVIPDVALEDVIWDGTQFVAVDGGTQGKILTSPDGLSWTEQSATMNRLHGVAWSGSQYVAMGERGAVWTSPNAIDWTRDNWSTWKELRDVTWDGTQFVGVGLRGQILTSPDGANWEPSDAPIGMLLYGVVWSSALETHVVVGDHGYILVSSGRPPG